MNLMGYDFVAGKTKKDIYENDNELIHIQCQYAYEPYFKEAFNCKRAVSELSGRLLKKDREKFIVGIDKFIKMANDGINIPMYQGNLSNCPQNKLVEDFEELKKLINEGKIGYISV